MRTRIFIICTVCLCLSACPAWGFGDKKTETTGVQSPVITGDNATVTYINGISPEQHQKLSEELGVTKSALKNFFKIIEQQQVPLEDLDSSLREIAGKYKELRKKLSESAPLIEDPQIAALKEKAGEALNNGDFELTEKYINEAVTLETACATQHMEKARKCLLASAESKSELGDLADTQLKYKKAANAIKKPLN